jgi:hypothetical protein
LLVSCAAEGPPHPPRVQRPVRVDDLKVVQTGATLRLSFTRPLLATDGRRLTKSIEVQIFRRVGRAQEKAPQPPIPTKPWVSISPDELGAYTEGTAIIYDDRTSKNQFSGLVGSTVSFAVLTLTRGFRGRQRPSELSNTAEIEVMDVSPPVQRVTITETAGGLELRWPAPIRSLTGSHPPAVLGYRIYRSTKPEARAYSLLAQTAKCEYDDRHFRFNQPYLYRVRAVFEVRPAVAESDASNPVSFTPRDIFPPPVPKGLSAVYTGRSVQLVWRPDTVTNLAGYNVYRQESGEPPQRLNVELLMTPAFADTSAKAPHQYWYWVTSVSLARNESGPSAKVRVDTK